MGLSYLLINCCRICEIPSLLIGVYSESIWIGSQIIKYVLVPNRPYSLLFTDFVLPRHICVRFVDLESHSIYITLG